MAFVISAPCIEYALYHDSIAAKVIEIVLTVHVSHMFHHIAIFRLEITKAIHIILLQVEEHADPG